MNNTLAALRSAVDLVCSQQAEIDSLNQSYASLAATNQQLTDELASYKQLEADAQADIDRLNALLPSPPPVPGGESPAPEPQAEVVTEAQIVPELQPGEAKTPDWATPSVPTVDPALVPVQIDVPIDM